MLDKSEINNQTYEGLRIIAIIELRESLDELLKARLQSNKVIEGLLKDIYGSISDLKN